MIYFVASKHTYVQYENCGEPIGCHPIQHWHATIWAMQPYGQSNKQLMYELSTLPLLRPQTGISPNSACIRAKDACKIQNRRISNASTYYPWYSLLMIIILTCSLKIVGNRSVLIQYSIGSQQLGLRKKKKVRVEDDLVSQTPDGDVSHLGVHTSMWQGWLQKLKKER